MTDPIPPAGLKVAPTVGATQLKAQLRIGLAAVAGMLVGRQVLPAGLVNDTTLDVATAIAIYGLTAGWQWFRVRLQHSRWWAMAIDPRVPADLVRPDPGKPVAVAP